MTLRWLRLMVAEKHTSNKLRSVASSPNVPSSPFVYNHCEDILFSVFFHINVMVSISQRLWDRPTCPCSWHCTILWLLNRNSNCNLWFSRTETSVKILCLSVEHLLDKGPCVLLSPAKRDCRYCTGNCYEVCVIFLYATQLYWALLKI